MTFLRANWSLIVLFFISIPAVFSLFQPGFFPMHDDTQVARVYEMGKSLSEGQFPVRWVKDLGYGYGYPLFNFYSPLPYYIGGFLTLLGIEALLATKFVFVLGIIFAGFSMYVLVKQFTEELAALVAGTVYLYFPYHAVNSYIRGDLDELFAYAFLPFVFLGVFKLYYKSKTVIHIANLWKEIVFLSLSLALVILSHNLSSVMLLFFVVPIIIAAVAFSKHKKSLAGIYMIAFVLGFGISGFYSLPALFEMKYANVLSQVGGGAHYADHFVCPIQLWDSLWGFGGSAVGCVDGMSFRLGKLNLILYVGSLIAFCYFFIKHKSLSNRLINYVSVVFFFASIVMMLPISKLIWDELPFMAFLQYPWRFLNFAGLFMALTIGMSIFQLEKLLGKQHIYALIIILLSSVLFYHSKLFTPKEYKAVDSYFYTNINALTWTTSKISDEYMPQNFQKPQIQNDVPKKPIDIIKGQGEIDIDSEYTGFIKAKGVFSVDSLVKLNIAQYPGWNVSVDDTLYSPEIGANGFYLSLRAGSHILQAELTSTPIARLSNVISLISVLSLIVGIIAMNSKLYGKKTS